MARYSFVAKYEHPRAWALPVARPWATPVVLVPLPIRVLVPASVHNPRGRAVLVGDTEDLGHVVGKKQVPRFYVYI